MKIEARQKLSAGIVGFGRFGQLLASILKPDFALKVFDSNDSLKEKALEIEVPFVKLEELLSAEIIFYCVPISLLESVIKEHLPIYESLGGQKTIIDVLSVKMHPKLIFDQLLPPSYEVMLTHPMFGPDSVRIKGLADQTMVIDKYRLSQDNFNFWKNYFSSKKLHIIEMSAEEHDFLAARSQGVTHLIGRVLDELDFVPTPIDTFGAKQLQSVRGQVCNDTWQLFLDLQTFNPYTAEMRTKMMSALDKISTRLDNRCIV